MTGSSPTLDTSLAAPSGDGGPPPPPVDPEAERMRERLWWAASVLYARRWFIGGVTILAAVASVALALLLPKWYQAEARVLLPEGGLNASALLNSISPGVKSLLGGGGGGYTRYLAILTSRTMMDDVVTRFDLEEVYETDDTVDPRGFAIQALESNVSFEVSLEYDYLAVQVLDRSPDRSARMANYFVTRLNEENTRLVSNTAAQSRAYLEARLQRAEVTVDSLFGDLQSLQEQYGVVEPEAQGSAAFVALGEAQSAVAEAAVRVEALRAEFGPENPLVESAEAGLSEARRQAESLATGNTALLPVPLRRLPTVARRYTQIQQELLIQGEILQAIQPLYEQAVMEESQHSDAVQVIDEAIPPVRKARPKRSIVVISLTASAALLGLLYALASAWLRERGPSIAGRLRG